MRVLKALISCFAVCLLLCGAAHADTRIMVVADVHHLATSAYTPDDPNFMKVAERAVGKAIRYSGELLDALVAEVKHRQPDALVVTGDLSFNGERISHEQLRDALASTGVPTVVIPGNHDINSENAVRFTEAGIEWIESPTSETFARIWEGMLADEIKGPGFSGVKKIDDRVWIVLGDYSVYEDHTEAHGMATEAHAEWIARVLSDAQQAGAIVISATHQTLLKHTDYSSHTFRVNKEKDIVAAMNDAGCRINLCGHMHIQHIVAKDEGLSEMATGAWCVSPHRYGMVTVRDDGSIEYRAQSVCGAHLPDGLAESTREFFRTTVMKGERIELMMNGIFDQPLLDMSRYAANVNEAYFAGTLSEHPEYATDPALEQWRAIRKTSTFGQYLSVIMGEPIEDALTWQSR